MRQVVDQLVRSFHRSGVDAEEGDAGSTVGQRGLGGLQQGERQGVDVVVSVGRDDTREEVGGGAEGGLSLEVGLDEAVQRRAVARSERAAGA